MSPTIAELYGDGATGHLMRQQYRTRATGDPKPKVQKALQKRHEPRRVGPDNVYRFADHEWKVPMGVLYYWHKPLRRHQMVVLHPWSVVWRSQAKRLRKEFSSLPAAVHFVATRAQYADPNAAVVAKHPYDIVPSLRGKLPRRHNGHMYYWCPLCVTARPFFAPREERTFWVLKKRFNETRGRYEWLDRRVRILRCRVCGCTNQNAAFRRSNQPWEKRKFKRGVRRARRK